VTGDTPFLLARLSRRRGTDIEGKERKEWAPLASMFEQLRELIQLDRKSISG